MFVDLSWLKLHPKETQEFHLEKLPENTGWDDDLKLVSPLNVDLAITNTGRLMVGQGRIAVLLELVCSRCLKEFNYHLNIPFTVEFCSEENRPHFKNEESFIYFDEPEVDLAPVVRENIILDLPIRALCSEECKGLCVHCGQDLNQGQCSCKGEETDPRWDELKKLFNGKEG